MRRLSIVMVALVLAGCMQPSGEPAKGFISPKIGNVYIPLEGSAYLVLEGDAAAVSLGNNVAVTNAHNANLVDSKMLIGKSTNYDLLFFHTPKATTELPEAPPRVGEMVIAYGQAGGGALRKAEGVITDLNAPVKALCDKCEVQSAFTFKGDAGPGFSGGPVVDATDGHLVGIIFGYVDEPGGPANRLIYAYTMSRVATELDDVQRKLPTDVD
ncbi:MAG: trypsin-like peptidase domain-containing protein [Alphaproteobacteria bacterium]|nr:trypsin-like peptidase domain-containing protein [Alphaproteobacteria bacterium]MDE1986126.1 trypsin-like peptidase domain-containing protein [Alphaproteobacteria bacterium]MDE2162879.1 trypsin-like peptidase domain-containing protein [Alphaproteobacteria bacterium]MDE2265963.1 trypsin-like peptidase domain-containing protein [Alphaproteobacteria bacterium]MDE2501060.1 trypsin-like peptidase domain-containing protein [Alphaproteobacteria bacterium]